MSAIEDAEALFEADVAIAHQIIHGDANTTVQTEGGPVKSFAKVVADNAQDLSGKQGKSEKNAASGYAGLNSDYSIVLKNVDGSVVSKMTTAAIAARTYTLPDRNITVAGTDDIAGIMGKLGQANGFAPLGSDSLIPAVYLPSFVDDVIEVDTKALLPATGEKGKIYLVDADETQSGSTTQYRWSGSQYLQIIASPGTTDNVAEGTRLYFTEARVLAAVLAGLSTATATLPTAADSVLSAIGKIVAVLGTKQNSASKDAASGYAGLTATYGINAKNAAGTFTSTLVNTATAARTYTFPDKNITVAGLADVLPTVATGLVTTDSSKAAATDTLLAILGKLQAQINAAPFDFTSFVSAKPSAGAKLLYVKLGRAVTFPANLAGSVVNATTAAAAATSWNVTKNGTSVATISFALGARVATFTTTGGTAVSFAVGDELVITANATQDTGLADIGVHLLANLT